MKTGKSAQFVLAFIVFVDTLGLGLILPVMPELIAEVAHTEIGRSSEIGGQLLFIYAAMQFVFAPILGGLSDRFGRRPVLLTTLFLLAIDYVIMTLAPTLLLLFVGRAISGIMGATWPAANSCIADLVEPDERGAAFGMLGGVGALGFVLGPAIGGIAGELGTRVPFAIAAFLAFCGFGLGLIFLKETLPLERRREFSLGRANPLGSIMQMTQTPFVLTCLAIVFLTQLAAQAQLSIWAYWGPLQFGWSPMISGLTVSFYGLLVGGVQAILTGRSISRFGVSNTARYSLLFGLPSYLLLATATSTTTVLLAIVVGAVSGMTFPALQGLMSARVAEDAQGELQGAVASANSLGSITGPLIMTQIFEYFSSANNIYFPGAPYAVSFIILCIAALLLWRISGRASAENP